MKTGDIKKIYDQPLTEQGLQGEAYLIKKILDDPVSGLEYWNIRFIDKKHYYPNSVRWIKKEGIIKKIYIGHFYGSDREIQEKTGYRHGACINDTMNKVIDIILKADLNVMVLQNGCNDGVIIWISKGDFKQR